MAKPDLALTMGALLAGAVVIDYGVKSFKTATASASGGSTPSTPTGSGTSPLPGVTKWERTDQGVDASAKPGSPVRAIVSGVVSAIIPNWYQGQPAVVIDSPNLPGGATGIYYAEQLSPNVHVGQHLNAGEQIGTVAQQGTGLEIGFSKGVLTLAQATGGYVEGQVTHAGELMRQFLGV